jgi:hypothetical protein
MAVTINGIISEANNMNIQRREDIHNRDMRVTSN